MGGADVAVGMTSDGARRRDLDARDQQSADERHRAERDIITNASATVVVDDIPAAAATIAEAAEARDGYVESMSIGTVRRGVSRSIRTPGSSYDSTMLPVPARRCVDHRARARRTSSHGMVASSRRSAR